MWLNVDIRNNNKDISFILKSTHKEIFPWTPKCPINKDLKVVEQFRNDFVTLRQMKTIKYKGGLECWQSLLDFDEIPNQDLISKLEIIVSNETYYTDCDESGVFQSRNDKNTFKINAHVDFNKISSSECDAMIQFLWKISEKLNKIII